MSGLKRLPEVIENMNEVAFVSDRGQVQIFEWEGEIVTEIGFEDVSLDEFEQHLDEVATHDEFTDEAEKFARELIEQGRESSDGNSQENDENTEEDTEQDTEDEDTTGDVVHTMDDNTEIRVGDRINHPGGWSYKITGKKGEHTLRKMDNTDDWGVVISTVERDIRQHGFDERVEVNE